MKAYRLFEWKKPARLVNIPIPEPGPGTAYDSGA
jgi:hypothetical protein